MDWWISDGGKKQTWQAAWTRLTVSGNANKKRMVNF
jgi:hypothetical protein